LKRDGKRAETRFCVSAKGTSPFKLVPGGGWGLFSRLLAAEVCVSAVVMVVMLDTPCSEAECKTTGYPLQSYVSPSIPLPCFNVCHQVTTELHHCHYTQVQHVRNAMAHAQKPDLVFQRNGRVHLNWRGCRFCRLLAVEECGSADRNCIDRIPTYSARLLAIHSIRIFPLHFPSRASPCAIRFRTRSTLISYKMAP